MAMSPADETSKASTPQDVERIRDIIFGRQMRDYEGRFGEVTRDLERLQQEIDRLTGALADQDGDHAKKLQGLRQELRTADDAIRAELRDTAQRLTADKVDRVMLGDLLIELGTALKMDGGLGDLPADLKALEDA
ncbi:MAG: hypothetical protein MUF84_04965 [Anaerolineae bacterium]|jgi:predicted  nucleic acid-binding Zn-ribbon protein|nr:hypothetical protein [Anaerolineae bacterium]